LPTEIKRICDVFRGSIVDVDKRIYTVELIGSSKKLNTLIVALNNKTDIIELTRSVILKNIGWHYPK